MLSVLNIQNLYTQCTQDCSFVNTRQAYYYCYLYLQIIFEYQKYACAIQNKNKQYLQFLDFICVQKLVVIYLQFFKSQVLDSNQLPQLIHFQSLRDNIVQQKQYHNYFDYNYYYYIILQKQQYQQLFFSERKKKSALQIFFRATQNYVIFFLLLFCLVFIQNTFVFLAHLFYFCISIRLVLGDCTSKQVRHTNGQIGRQIDRQLEFICMHFGILVMLVSYTHFLVIF
eukprot:TRINITY_DN2140_c0_g1_i2.p1 TRINITY_DN2140_c0_g1~~TRINITY_DN2140_c0_g1_i2.p1  ORF type:complete len:227 (-),score=-14.52 TRINITY_DN2140_c0_g1_i2:363-1043(-)